MHRKAHFGLAAFATLLLVASAARAEHRYDPVVRVQGLAAELSYATRDLWQAARYNRHHYDRAERRALDELYDLHERAEHFYRQVGRRWTSDHHVAHDFHKLERAWQHVAWDVRALHPYRDVEARLARVSALMADLRYAMEPFLHRVDRRHDRGRHDRRWVVPRFRFDLRWWR